MLGFPAKYAEASWLLEVGVMVFPLISVTLDMAIFILGVPNLSVGSLVAFFTTLVAICQLGDTREDHGRTHGGPEPDFS